eukprot:m.129957 g.129957  ORF g.129957 m.129957 type:complete len:81 (+) comp13053_c0_seq5:79-321(+)
MRGKGEGDFLLRPYTKEGIYILSVIFKGKCSHHLLKKNGKGLWTLNNKHLTTARTTNELISFLCTKRKWWPLELGTGIVP